MYTIVLFDTPQGKQIDVTEQTDREIRVCAAEKGFKFEILEHTKSAVHAERRAVELRNFYLITIPSRKKRRRKPYSQKALANFAKNKKGAKNPNFGKHHSEETKAKISAKMKQYANRRGHKSSTITKAKMKTTRANKYWAATAGRRWIYNVITGEERLMHANTAVPFNWTRGRSPHVYETV